MGPDLFGIAWASGFLLVVIVAFALADRLLCGAWDALRGSPGAGLVQGLAAWNREGDGTPAGEDPATGSPGGASPGSSDPVATERVGRAAPRPRDGGRMSIAPPLA